MAMSTRIVRWGVMSTAKIGRGAVIPAIHRSVNGVVAAVASRNEERAKEFAHANEIPIAHGSYEALLDDGGIDAVYIPLPNSMHREWTIRAAQAGKHVLCEKPISNSAAECDEMDAAANAAGVKCMEAFMYRFHPRVARTLGPSPRAPIRRRNRNAPVGLLRLHLQAGTTRQHSMASGVRWRFVDGRRVLLREREPHAHRC